MGKERLYRVLVIAISLRSNKIANFDDEIAESQFSAPIADLISGGYIEEVIDEKNNSNNDDESKKAKDDKANSVKTDDSDKKEETANLGDIANSIPGAKANTAKK